MSQIRIFNEYDPRTLLTASAEPAAIAAELRNVGVRFEQWSAPATLPSGAAQEEVLAAYAADIARLKAAGGYRAVDVISMAPTHPDKAAMRAKFLNEHVHSEDEVRFFVAGHGLFTLHIEQKVYEILCTQGDLLGVPANTRHWFDMGPNPSFVAIRLFINPAGWVANMTTSDIAARFTRLAA